MFAAYKLSENEVAPTESGEFLQNQSYESSSLPPSASTVDCVQNISSDETFSSSSSEDEAGDNSKAVQIYHKPPPTKLEVFYEDREPRREYLKMDSMPKRALPYYHTSRYRLTPGFRRTAKKFKRYFNQKKDKKHKKGVAMEIETDKSEELRLHLIRNQNDIDKWKEFIDLKVS
jgi:hypothetical protein